MKTRFRTVTGLFLLYIIMAPRASAQSFENVPTWHFGAGVGMLVYQGDLSPGKLGSYKTLRPVVGIYAGKLVTSSVSWRIGLALGSLKGDEAKYEEPEYHQQRALNFTTSVTEVNAMVAWNLFGRNYSSRGLSPYVGLGLGYAFLKVKRDWSRLNQEYFNPSSATMTGLAEDLQETPPRGQIVVPIMVGLSYSVNDRININLETNYRRISTDYLDGFSAVGNPKQADSYYSNTIGIQFRLGKMDMMSCPVVRY